MDRFDVDRTRASLLKRLELFVARAMARVSQIASQEPPSFVPPLGHVPTFSFLGVGPHSEITSRR
jgi:hypothetical protein